MRMRRFHFRNNVLFLIGIISLSICNAQTKEAVFFLYEKNVVQCLDCKTIKNIQISTSENIQALQNYIIEKDRDKWFVTPKDTGHGTLIVKCEGNKNVVIGISIIEFPKFDFRFDDNYDYVKSFEDAEKDLYVQNKPLIDSIRNWIKTYPEYKLKTEIRPFVSHFQHELFSKVEYSIIEVKYRDSTVLNNYKITGTILPIAVIKELIKYDPKYLSINFREIELIMNSTIRKKFYNMNFDFKS